MVCRLTLDGALTVYGRGSLEGPEEPIAHHVLTDPDAGWQCSADHHRRLWAEAMPVEVRDLSVYEEVA